MKTSEIHWEITNQCNLQCNYCRSNSGKPAEDELSKNESLEAIKKFKNAGIKRICFTGGEPFSRADFKELIKFAVDIGIEVSIITNGTLINSDELDLIQSLNIKLNLSLDSITPLINDRLRGKNVHSLVLNVLEECKKRKLNLQLYATISKKNLSQLDSLVVFAKKYGNRIHFKEISTGGRLKDNNKLLLSPSEKEKLKNFENENTIAIDEKCWADGESIFMSSNGSLYLCNEIFVRQPNLKIGNIKSFDFSKKFASKKDSNCNCCYGAIIGEKAVTLFNTENECEFINNLNAPINTLSNLYKELDECYKDIKNYCFSCKEKDCMGYTWLLKSEARRLYNANIPLVKINDGPTFIHSFPIKENGSPDVSIESPICGQIDCSGRICLIRSKRPLVCHMYPVGLETLKDGTVVWAIHLDCLFIKKLDEQKTLNEFENKFQMILNRISIPLLDEIISTYKKVDEISIFLNGDNKFKILKGGI